MVTANFGALRLCGSELHFYLEIHIESACHWCNGCRLVHAIDAHVGVPRHRIERERNFLDTHIAIRFIIDVPILLWGISHLHRNLRTHVAPSDNGYAVWHNVCGTRSPHHIRHVDQCHCECGAWRWNHGVCLLVVRQRHLVLGMRMYRIFINAPLYSSPMVYVHAAGRPAFRNGRHLKRTC